MAIQFPKDQIFISKLTEIIRTNLRNENFNVKELAHQMDVNLYSLNRRLYAITNKTARQFVRETRLLKALEMLQNEELTAAEVAYKVGFSSPAYFNTCFHEYYGYPPGEVKKRKPDNGKITSENLIPETGYSKKLKGWLIILIAVLLCMTAAFGVFKIMGRRNQIKEFAKLEKSIAVLPFINDSPDQENTYFINGIMEEIFTDLQKFKDVRVVSRTSAEKYRGRAHLTLPQIAKDLDVNYIVEGSGQKSGNTYVLRVQLIAAHKEKHLWAGSYEQVIQDTKDIFKVQNQVAQEIASALQVIITPEEKKLIEHISTANLTAYDFYQRGREEHRIYWSDNGNKQALIRAEYLYKRALAFDSTFARAYSGLAETYRDKHVYESYYAKNYLDSVIIMADRALSYDDHLAEAYCIRAEYYLQSGKFEQALKEYDKALKYNPNYSEAYYGKGYKIQVWDYHFMDFVKGIENIHKAVRINHGRELAFYLRELGDAYGIFAGIHEKAMYYYQQALELDGDTTSYLCRLGDEANVSGNFAGALEYYNRGFAKDSNKVWISWGLASAYELHGQYKEALKYVKKFEKRLETYPNLVYTSRRMMGYVYLKTGSKNEADHLFMEQKRISEESIKMGRFYSIDANYDIAALYTFLGEKKKAYENLRSVNKIHICPLWLLNLIKNDPFFDSIRDEPEFQEIVIDLEAKYQAEHERVRKWLEEQEKL
jgi:TolB-like protein/AraC-like DNA-binding protein